MDVNLCQRHAEKCLRDICNQKRLRIAAVQTWSLIIRVISGKLGQILEGHYIFCCRPLLRLVITVTVLHDNRGIPNTLFYIKLQLFTFILYTKYFIGANRNISP